MARHSPILWQNSSATATLIDIPQSIASAQGTVDDPFPYHLLSTPPLSAPFPNVEPKSAKARARLVYDADVSRKHETLHREYETVVQQALDQIRLGHQGSWCRPRPFVEARPRSRKRRILSDDVTTTLPRDITGGEEWGTSILPSELLSHLARDDHAITLTVHQNTPADHQNTNAHTVNSAQFYTNPDSTHPVSLQITSSTISQTYTFHIPPNSSFSLSDCTKSFSFRKHIHHHAQQIQTKKTFDFILLDPPWPNRSVRRTHKTQGSTYSIASTASEIREMLLDLNLDLLMSDDCWVGVWITNKAAIRELVLDESGLFDCWNVKLVEEWLWLKTTVSGEPVLPCDGVGRKPYEILLLGRKRRGLDNAAAVQDEIPPKRRVIFAVPDLHSRKPCLKELIETLLPEGNDYRTLEVFARYLVSGWCSWGDECIKFNWEGYWRKAAST